MSKFLRSLATKLIQIERSKVLQTAKRYETDYSCGIFPFPPKPPMPPPPPPPTFPKDLMRPPCLPGQEKAAYRPGSSLSGFYCPGERKTYQYPSFSENIDFVPSGSTDCWWASPKTCDYVVADHEDSIPFRI